MEQLFKSATVREDHNERRLKAGDGYPTGTAIPGWPDHQMKMVAVGGLTLIGEKTSTRPCSPTCDTRCDYFTRKVTHFGPESHKLFTHRLVTVAMLVSNPLDSNENLRHRHIS